MGYSADKVDELLAEMARCVERIAFINASIVPEEDLSRQYSMVH